MWSYMRCDGINRFQYDVVWVISLGHYVKGVPDWFSYLTNQIETCGKTSLIKYPF